MRSPTSGRVSSRGGAAGTIKRRAAPDANVEYLLYQTLVGVWPLGGPRDAVERGALRERVTAYMRKAAREAKAQTSWTDADAQYEQALEAFVASLIDADEGAGFRDELTALVERVGRAGWWTALARTAIQVASPGTPDTYQGAELWSLALVDPDNRRPVDFARRAELLDALREPDAAELLRGAEDGRVKLHVLRTMLSIRRDDPALFAAGDYVPLEVTGVRAADVVAFARVLDGRGVAVVAPRLCLQLCTDGAPPIGVAVWGDTEVRVPDVDCPLHDRLTGASHAPGDRRLLVGRLLSTLPVACLAW